MTLFLTKQFLLQDWFERKSREIFLATLAAQGMPSLTLRLELMFGSLRIDAARIVRCWDRYEWLPTIFGTVCCLVGPMS